MDADCCCPALAGWPKRGDAVTTLPISLEYPIDARALAEAARALVSEGLWPVAIRKDIEAEIYWIAFHGVDQADAGQLLAAYAPGKRRGNWRAWLWVALLCLMLAVALGLLAVALGWVTL